MNKPKDLILYHPDIPSNEWWLLKNVKVVHPDIPNPPMEGGVKKNYIVLQYDYASLSPV